MYLYLATKPEIDDKVVYDLDGLRKDGYICFTEEDAQSEYYEELLPYTQKIRGFRKDVDFDKIVRKYCLDNDIHWGYYCGEYRAINSHSDTILILPIDEINAKYVCVNTYDYYITELEELRYWRKAYEAQDFFYDNLKADNTKYCLVSNTLIQEYKEMFDDQVEIPSYDEEKSGLFYWEWY